MKIKIKKMKKTVRIQKIQKEKIMKTHAIRINKMFFTSMLILSLGYTSTLTFTTDVAVDYLTIAAGDKIVLNTGVTMTVGGDVVITGELEMDGNSVVNVDGDVDIAASGTLNMEIVNKINSVFRRTRRATKNRKCADHSH